MQAAHDFRCLGIDGARPRGGFLGPALGFLQPVGDGAQAALHRAHGIGVEHLGLFEPALGLFQPLAQFGQGGFEAGIAADAAVAAQALGLVQPRGHVRKRVIKTGQSRLAAPFGPFQTMDEVSQRVSHGAEVDL